MVSLFKYMKAASNRSQSFNCIIDIIILTFIRTRLGHVTHGIIPLQNGRCRCGNSLPIFIITKKGVL